MMEKIDFINKSLRLRYEAFSKFATDVNQAGTFEEVGKAMVTHFKFVFDAYKLRLSFLFSEEKLIVELFRGDYHLLFNEEDGLSGFDDKYIQSGLPLVLNKEQILRDESLAQSTFAHPRICHLFALPLEFANEQRVVAIIASKNDVPFADIDFQFIRLFCEMLATKFSQLILTEKTARQNADLHEVNEELTVLNHEVQTLNNRLEKLVEQRTQKLAEAQKELNTLFYRTSHDFRRPLSSILGLANLIEGTEDQQEVPFLVKMLKNSLTELNVMLDKLQTISLTELEDSALTSIQLTDTLASIYHDRFSGICQREGIHFSYQVTGADMFSGHAEVLKAILENLIENAIQYRRAESPYVSVDISRQEQNLCIVVKDNGEGIAEEYQPMIFDMYFRASEKATGNGLGLYIVRKLVEKFEGTISFETQVNQGSVFKITLPYKQQRKPVRKRKMTSVY